MDLEKECPVLDEELGATQLAPAVPTYYEYSEYGYNIRFRRRIQHRESLERRATLKNDDNSVGISRPAGTNPVQSPGERTRGRVATSSVSQNEAAWRSEATARKWKPADAVLDGRIVGFDKGGLLARQCNHNDRWCRQA